MHYPLSDLADFAFILIFFVMPALFSSTSGNVTVPNAADIPWLTVIVYTALTAYMAIRYSHSDKEIRFYRPEGRNSRFSRIFLFFNNSIVNIVTPFFCLLLSNFIVSRMASVSGGADALPSIRVTAETTADRLFLVFWTALLAAFEEFTYRWLIPSRLLSLWAERRPKDEYTITRKVLCELGAVCLFALSHRYMGWWAVLNAFIAGVILRTNFFVSGSVYPALIAHILYNLTAFYGILKP